ncbi:antibiotic biosynthesis monooxygenase [Amnibacterium kyonggiense]|uniref:Antibiotic biosynthesis monooxygenase n=2 Tax=Amnibacterium kyonggiense TaxID=595671 RepID=A0A4R7FP86_9MICO|nr:antibiotic biosynthesis monooxygenase [Amnibacterium kyonggiense]
MRDELVARLVQRNETLRALGCQLYEVGTNSEQPDTVFVVEIWDSAEAHSASLRDPHVAAAIAEARHLLNGHFGGFRFEVSGSPLRDG